MTSRKITNWTAEIDREEQAITEASAAIQSRRESSLKRFGLAKDRYITQNQHYWREAVARTASEVIESELERLQWKDSNVLPGPLAKFRRQVDRYLICGSEYIKLRCKECSRYYLGPSRCESRACPACARRYAARIRRRQEKILCAMQPRRGRRLMFLTVTVKTPSDLIQLGQSIRLAFHGFQKLMHRYYPRQRGSGGFAVLEVGANNNVHIHAIIYGFYVSQKILSDYWLKVTGDSWIVDIRSIRSPKQCLSYLLKYVTKSVASDDPGWVAYCLYALIGQRRIRTYGVFYNYPLRSKDPSFCPLCGGGLQFSGMDSGELVPLNALLWEEARKLAATN